MIGNLLKPGLGAAVIAALVAAAGCASTPIPNEKIAVARDSVQRAEQAGVAAFLVIDFLASALAFALERRQPEAREDAWLLSQVWLQRFAYRQVFSLVLFRTVKRAIQGRPFAWDKLERAEKDAANRDAEPATLLAEQANADAQLAEATADQKRSHKAALDFEAGMQALRQESMHDTGINQ